MEHTKRFWPFQTKITIYCLGLVLLIQLTSAFFYFKISDQLISSSIQESSASSVSNFMQDIRLKLDTLKSVQEREDFLRAYMDLMGSNFFLQFRGETKDLLSISFVDDKGSSLAGDPILQAEQGVISRMVQHQGAFTVSRLEQLVVFVPLMHQDHFYGGIILHFTKDRINKDRGTLLMFTVISILFFSIIGAVGSFIISLEITLPIKNLLKSLELIGKGQFDTKIKVRENDEIGLLGKSVHDMATALKAAQEMMKKYHEDLERQVDERTKQLEDSKGFLDQIINNIPSPIFVKDEDHRWILLNGPYCDFMGYKKEELIGKSDFDFFPKQEAEVFWQKDQLVLDSGQININEEYFTDAKGMKHFIITKKVPFYRENGEKTLVGIINDITESKAYEQRILKLNTELQEFNEKLKKAYDQLARSERLAAMGEMAAMIGHELRNSLGVIRNSVYYLKKKLPLHTQEQALIKYLDILENEVSISDKVIGGILTYNRIKQPVLLRTDINAIITRILEKIDFPQGILKESSLDPSLPEINVDADQMGQVFTNIVSNAIDAMPRGGKLSVKSFRRDAGLVVEFSDTGAGIAHEELSKIFKIGFTTKQHGSGLGLAICESIVGLHNGKIEAFSQIGKGTAIIIYLPLKADI